MEEQDEIPCRYGIEEEDSSSESDSVTLDNGISDDELFKDRTTEDSASTDDNKDKSGEQKKRDEDEQAEEEIGVPEKVTSTHLKLMCQADESVGEMHHRAEKRKRDAEEAADVSTENLKQKERRISEEEKSIPLNMIKKESDSGMIKNIPIKTEPIEKQTENKSDDGEETKKEENRWKKENTDKNPEQDSIKIEADREANNYSPIKTEPIEEDAKDGNKNGSKNGSDNGTESDQNPEKIFGKSYPQNRDVHKKSYYLFATEAIRANFNGKIGFSKNDENSEFKIEREKVKNNGKMIK